ncbi:MAG: fumarate hydratase [Firmicutes bacterium]|nr:fumarate hydratase [Bacillota bacterium]
MERGWPLEQYEAVTEAVAHLYVKALKDLPPDVRAALEAARSRESSGVGRTILQTIERNIAIADEQSLLICQDTGTPVYFVEVGEESGCNPIRLERAIREGTERATREHPLRSSVVSPISRQNRQTNTGYRVPVIHWEFVAGSPNVEILVIPKGSGSENMSYFRMLLPADGVAGVKRFVVESVVGSGGNPCPPVIVGVGLGGSADLCMLLAKKAIARPCGSINPDPEVAGLEQELLEAINQSGLGPMGLGGATTALAVHVEHAATHISQNPVAVNIQCWAARRGRLTIGPEGEMAIGY